MALVSWDAGRRTTLSILSSTQETDVLDIGGTGKLAAYHIGILAPTAFTGTITIDVSDDEAGPFRTLQSDNVDVALTAGKATILSPIPFRYLQIVSSASEAADRNIFLIAHS